jgi:S-DNA-T family DNA segregation ATPase FtsK/SpoIIIE
MTSQDSAQRFNRPPRIRRERLHGEIDIPAPPGTEEQPRPNVWLYLLPAAGILVLAALYALIGGASGAGAMLALPMLALGLISVLTAIVALSTQRAEQQRRLVQARRNYHRLLDRRLVRLQAARELQRYDSVVAYPPPTALNDLIAARDPALWNRRPGDDDFTTVRLGEGDIPSAVRLRVPDLDIASRDARRAARLAAAYARVPDASVTLNLRAAGSLGLIGPREETLSFAYALLAHLVTFHAPTELNLYVFSSRIRYRSWSWARWLPHTSASARGGFPDFIAFEADHARTLIDSLARRLEARAEAAHADQCAIVAVFDDVASIRDEVAYQTVIGSSAIIGLSLSADAAEVPEQYGGMIQVAADGFHAQLVSSAAAGSAPALRGRADRMPRAQIELLARQLAGLKLTHASDAGRIPTSLDLLQMHNVERIDALDIRGRWGRAIPAHGNLPLAVPIGNDSFSSQLMFDLSERAHGPHGVVAGTTGSGKSELLQTMVAALAVAHHPYLVNFLLIDYKGGATFNVFRDLPHTVGMITNLNGIEALRALEAIKAENRRRQRFLAERGAEHITEYHRRAARGGALFPPDWEPLPHLVIIVDEFAELTAELPGFLDELVATVRVGRSLGMHLVLATQRPAGHVTPEMGANLNFRLCLRVQTPEESRELIRRPDAAFLPPGIPGRAYFLVGNTLQQFQVARVGGEHHETTGEALPDVARPVLRLVRHERAADLLAPFEAGASRGQHPPDAPTATQASSLAAALVSHMAGLCREMALPPLPPVLLESLPDEVALDRVLAASAFGGWDGERWLAPGPARGWACAPIGLIDDLGSRLQPPLIFDFPREGGHLVVVGGPGTGKTTLLRTLIMALARLFRPDEVEIYALSFAGRGLDIFERLPHVGAVIREEEGERLRRLVRRLLTELETRRRAFAQLNADDLEAYNTRAALRSGGELAPFPAIFVLIDNFIELRGSFPDEIEDILRLIQDGRAVGFHFAITSPSADLPRSLVNLIEQRFAFRLPERGDYRLLFSRVSERDLNPRPGSGLLGGMLHCQVALPADGADDDARDAHLHTTIGAMAHAWGSQPAAAPVHILPELAPLDGPGGLLETLVAAPDAGSGARPAFRQPQSVIGLEGMTLKPWKMTWGAEGGHFLIAGTVASGKSSLLRTLLLSAAAHYAPSEVALLLVDFGRESLRPLRHLPHVLSYVSDEQALIAQLRRVHAELAWRRAAIERERGSDGMPDVNEAMTEPFPALFVAIDDYDQVQDALGGAGFELLDALGQAVRREGRVGLHVLVAGETTAMARAGDTMLRLLRLTRSGFSLGSAEGVELLGGRVTPAMRRDELPTGRGYHVSRYAVRLVQGAYCPDPARLARDIAAFWRDVPRAEWLHPPDAVSVGGVPTVRPGQSGAGAPALDFGFDLDGALQDYRKQQGYE